MDKRCSILYCPWKAKYQFTTNYLECWFHGGDYKLELLWAYITRPIRFLYNFIRYSETRGKY